MRIVCVGDCGIDHYVSSDERRVGGITANFALHARRLFAGSDSIRIIAPLGDDSDAALVRRRFIGTDIDCDFVSMAGRTPVQFLDVDDSGERQFLRYEEGVLRDYRVDDRAAERIGQADLVMTPVFEQNLEMFRSVLAVPTRGLLAIDFADFADHPNFRTLEECIDRLDVGFFGLGKDDQHIIDRLRSAAAGRDRLLVVTLSKHGSVAFDGDSDHRCEAERVAQVIDTTGAGDAFAAGFLSRYVKDRQAPPALSAGSLTAARAIQALGGN